MSDEPTFTVEEIRSALDLSALQVVREPLTYERDSPHSYFRDRFLAEKQGDIPAQARLERHAAEIAVEIPKMKLRQADGTEYRINPNRIDGTGGFFSPPLWLIQYFSTGARAKRVLASMIPNFYLPGGYSTVNVPRIVTATRTEDQADLVPVESKNFTDTDVESPAMTIAGQAEVSLQLLEQSPVGASVDWAILKDLRESYDLHLEEKLFNGVPGNSQEFTGILNLTTGAKLASKVEYTAPSPTGPAMFQALGKVAAQAGDSRKLPPEIWLMRTARWAWLGSSQDLNDLPLAVPGHQPPPPIPYLFDDDKPSAVTAILGWPVFCDDAIPANLGAEENQDAVFAVRPTDSMLFESTERTLIDKESLSGDLQVRFLLHRYAAFLPRYPGGFAYLVGTGLKVESGF